MNCNKLQLHYSDSVTVYTMIHKLLCESMIEVVFISIYSTNQVSHSDEFQELSLIDLYKL